MFTVGDKVMVRHHTLEEKENYRHNYGLFWHPYMDEMEGKTYVIDGKRGRFYLVHDDKLIAWTFPKRSLVKL